jgi:raw score 9.21
MYFYDKTTNGFYIEDLHDIPQGATGISEETYRTLLDGQAAGKQIIANKQGNPVLVDPQPSDAHELNLDTLIWEIPQEKLTALLKHRKSSLMTTIANKTDNFKAQYLQGYSQAEIDSFYRQEREARNELPLMLLTEIFEGRDDLKSVDELKKKVIEKADLFAIIMGKLFAIKQGFETHIEKAQTMEDLDKIEEDINKWQKI